MDWSVSVGLRRHFEKIADAYYDIVDRIWYDVGYYHQRESEVIQAPLASLPTVSIDAGCGPGRHTAMLAASSRRVVAVDISRRMLELTHRRAPGVDLIQADVRHLPLKALTGDLVLNMEVLEHLPGGSDDVLSAFREFHRVLRPGGTLVTEAPLTTHGWWRTLGIKPPSWKELPAELRKEFYQDFPLTVENPYGRSYVERSLKEVGFQRASREFVRVLPAGLVETHPWLTRLDRILERVPIIRLLSREAIWTSTKAGAR